MPVSVKFDFELLSIDFNKTIFINFIHKKQFYSHQIRFDSIKLSNRIW